MWLCISMGGGGGGGGGTVSLFMRLAKEIANYWQ